MFKENFVIKGELVCETGLHIGGSNDNIDIGGTDNVIIRDVITNFIENIHQTTMVELNKPIFLLIDEVHFDKNWTLTGKIVYDNNNNIFMIFTGSSAIELQIHADAIRRMEKKTNISMYISRISFFKTEHTFSKGDVFCIARFNTKWKC